MNGQMDAAAVSLHYASTPSKNGEGLLFRGFRPVPDLISPGEIPPLSFARHTAQMYNQCVVSGAAVSGYSALEIRTLDRS